MKILTTGLGSVPHLHWQDALHHSLQHDVPFYPELYNLDAEKENMLTRGQRFFNGEEIFPHFNEFLRAAKLQKAQSVKLQLVHPLTYNNYQKEKFSIENFSFERIENYQHRAKDYGLSLWWLFDAPNHPCNEEFHLFHQKCQKHLSATLFGYHNCGKVDWDFLPQLEGNYLYSLPYKEELAPLMKQLSKIKWIAGLEKKQKLHQRDGAFIYAQSNNCGEGLKF